MSRWMSGAAMLALAFCCALNAAAAGRIDTSFLDGEFPDERSSIHEVGRDEVLWRFSRSPEEVYAGVGFAIPVAPEKVWEETLDFQDLKRITPGVQSVTVIEDTGDYQQIEIGLRLFWRDLKMRFELERENERLTRFRLRSPELGEYVGYMRLAPEAGPEGEGNTRVEIATWLKPAVPVSTRMLLLAQRMILLRSTAAFIESCRRAQVEE